MKGMAWAAAEVRRKARELIIAHPGCMAVTLRRLVKIIRRARV